MLAESTSRNREDEDGLRSIIMRRSFLRFHRRSLIIFSDDNVRMARSCGRRHWEP